MKGILQEKFQIAPHAKNESGESWASFESCRVTHPQTRLQMPNNEILEPAMSSMNLSLAGETDVSDDVNGPTLIRGYQKRTMKPQEDMYNGEHVDLFYGDPTVDGVTGFVERNNYLDRA